MAEQQISEDFKRLQDTVQAAGDEAVARQSGIGRDYKSDGSVITEVDLALDRSICGVIASAFPNCNIISEENPSSFQPGSPYTFVIDPIDGTDAYSQGMPGWCVALGILNSQLLPVGGIVYAPRWGYDREQGLFLSALPGDHLRCNGKLFTPPEKTKDRQDQIMVASKLHRHYALSSFPGKLRSIGSTILHILSPLIHSGIRGAVLSPCFIWDIAAAHAIVDRASILVQNTDGTDIDYAVLVHRQKAKKHIVVGAEEEISYLENFFSE